MLIYVVAELFQQQTDTKGFSFKIQLKLDWTMNMSIFSVPNPESKERFIVKKSLQFLISLADDFHIENRSNLVKLIYY